jgi:hypothetical protein
MYLSNLSGADAIDDNNPVIGEDRPTCRQPLLLMDKFKVRQDDPPQGIVQSVEQPYLKKTPAEPVSS